MNSTPARALWLRTPVLVRAVVTGSLVQVGGGLLTLPVVLANLRLRPDIPWSVPVLSAYLFLFWLYLGGRGWPRATAEWRRRSLRAGKLSRRLWGWSLLAGGLAFAANVVLHLLAARFTPLGYFIPEVLRAFPPVTLFSILLVLPAMAGVVEEAAFRGYMQGPIEARHGAGVALCVVSAVFGLAHLSSPGMTAPRMLFILYASLAYGLLVRIVDSILPGVVLHATGDALGLGWLWWRSQRPGPAPLRQDLSSASADPTFWIACAAATFLLAASARAFVGLARAAKREREPSSFGTDHRSNSRGAGQDAADEPRPQASFRSSARSA